MHEYVGEARSVCNQNIEVFWETEKKIAAYTGTESCSRERESTEIAMKKQWWFFWGD